MLGKIGLFIRQTHSFAAKLMNQPVLLGYAVHERNKNMYVCYSPRLAAAFIFLHLSYKSVIKVIFYGSMYCMRETINRGYNYIFLKVHVSFFFDD